MDRLADLELRKAVWLLPVIWAIHSIEEWFLYDHYVRRWQGVGDLTAADVRVWLVLMASLGFLWTFVATRLRRDWLAIGAVLLFFVSQGVGNFAQHVYWMIAFDGDSPGIWTSVLLVLPCCLYLSYRAGRERVVKWWFLALVYLTTVPILVVTIQLGDAFPEDGLPMYRLSGAIADALGL